jgi:hypothetical protein
MNARLTTVRWHVRGEGRPSLLVSESVRPWRPAEPEPATAPPDPTPAQGWTEERVRARLAEAMTTLRKLPVDPRARPSTQVVRWPDVVRDRAEAYGYSDAKTVTRPDAAQIQRLDEVLPWLFLIEDGKQRLAVVGVATGINLRAIGRTLGCSHETVRSRERAGIFALVRALNGDRGSL